MIYWGFSLGFLKGFSLFKGVLGVRVGAVRMRFVSMIFEVKIGGVLGNLTLCDRFRRRWLDSSSN